jgi:FkbM family methyltransferase
VRVPKKFSLFLDKAGLSPDSPLRAKANDFFVRRQHERHINSIKPRLSYGQFGEDAILQAFLPEETGFYVDIGSGHPIQGSNTYALYQLGWTGILIDPVLSNISLSQQIRPNDQVIHAAVGLTDQEHIEFIEFETYQYSTTSEARAAVIVNLGHPVRERYLVPIRSLEEVVLGANVKKPAVLSIDVEGQEINVLESNNWNTFTPDFILVEDLSPPWEVETVVASFLKSNGYELLAISGVTCLYRQNLPAAPMTPGIS